MPITSNFFKLIDCTIRFFLDTCVTIVHISICRKLLSAFDHLLIVEPSAIQMSLLLLLLCYGWIFVDGCEINALLPFYGFYCFSSHTQGCSI